MGSKGIVASTAAMGVLLQEGIGDTIRVSLTPEPGGDRTEEVIVSQEILQTMGLRSFTPMVIACPGCGRPDEHFFPGTRLIAYQSYLRAQMPQWRGKHPGVETMTVAVMGCVVNGPGESKHANVGISLPGTGENPVAPVFVDWRENRDAEGRSHCRRISGSGGALYRAHLRCVNFRHEGFVGKCGAMRRGGVKPDARQVMLAKQLHKDWKLVPDSKSLKRSLKFNIFAMSFVNALAHVVVNREDHHPDLEVGYDYCHVTYSTHSIGGLSVNDFIRARL